MTVNFDNFALKSLISNLKHPNCSTWVEIANFESEASKLLNLGYKFVDVALPQVKGLILGLFW